MPERIQRKRMRGWTMPANTVYVGRPSKWGNQFRVTEDRSREQTLWAYEVWLRVCAPAEFKAAVRKELAGKNLACWCPLNKRCHADLLLNLANESAASPEMAMGAAIIEFGEGR